MFNTYVKIPLHSTGSSNGCPTYWLADNCHCHCLCCCCGCVSCCCLRTSMTTGRTTLLCHAAGPSPGSSRRRLMRHSRWGATARKVVGDCGWKFSCKGAFYAVCYCIDPSSKLYLNHGSCVRVHNKSASTRVGLNTSGCFSACALSIPSLMGSTY